MFTNWVFYSDVKSYLLLLFIMYYVLIYVAYFVYVKDLNTEVCDLRSVYIIKYD